MLRSTLTGVSEDFGAGSVVTAAAITGFGAGSAACCFMASANVISSVLERLPGRSTSMARCMPT